MRLRCWSQQPRGVAAAHGRASVVVACVTPPRLRVHAAGCTKSAQSSTQFCVRHGGGRKCMVEGCSKVGKRRTARSLSPRPRRTEFEVCALNMCAMLVFWCVRWTGMFGVGWRALVFQVSRGTTKLCASHAKTPRCACGHVAVSRIASCSTCTLLLLLSQLRRTPHSLATSPKSMFELLRVLSGVRLTKRGSALNTLRNRMPPNSPLGPFSETGGVHQHESRA